jgi:hypothetical protein
MPHLSLVRRIQLVGDFNQKLSLRFTCRKIDMRLTNAFRRKGIFSVDVDPQGPTGHQGPELRAIVVAFFERYGIICHPETMQRGCMRR